MKLRNKETGVIIETYSICENGQGKIVIRKKDEDFKIYPYEYDSIAELNEEWEVYEEPKEYWLIDTFIYEINYLTEGNDADRDNFNKEIGNYFDTREEAEKAVEKLKALTEAKEDGLKIKGYYYNHEDLVILADIGKCNKLTLDTLFGKEID